MTENPLSEASTDSIDELMSRDPLGLSKIDLAKLISTLREQRKNWLQDEASGAKKAKKAKAQAKETAESLDDLGL